QGAASLALGYVLHWAFSPPLLNQKFEMLNRMLRFYKIKAASFLRRVSRLLKKPTRDASPPLVLAFFLDFITFLHHLIGWRIDEVRDVRPPLFSTRAAVCHLQQALAAAANKGHTSIIMLMYAPCRHITNMCIVVIT
ncbi:hypothetical protein, partial [Prevotellamassilia timonensis]